MQMLEILRRQPYLSGEISLNPQEGELMPETYSFIRGDSRDSIGFAGAKGNGCRGGAGLENEGCGIAAQNAAGIADFGFDC